MQGNLNKGSKFLSLLSRTKDHFLAVFLWRDRFLPQTLLNYLVSVCQKTIFSKRKGSSNVWSDFSLYLMSWPPPGVQPEKSPHPRGTPALHLFQESRLKNTFYWQPLSCKCKQRKQVLQIFRHTLFVLLFQLLYKLENNFYKLLFRSYESHFLYSVQW